MKNIFTIFFKEMRRIFTDKRMLLALFVPGIMIFIIYTLMGNLMNSQLFNTKINDTTYKIVYTDNYSSNTDSLPKLISYFDLYLESAKDDVEKGNKVEKTIISSAEVDDFKQKLIDDEYHILIEFTDNFENNIGSSLERNNVSLFYNGSNEVSSYLYGLFNQMIPEVYNDYTVNVDSTGLPVNPNLVEDDFILKKVMAFVLPMVTISLLYSTILTLVPETISGEKERGTLSILLLTPVKRSNIVLGKVLALTVAAVAAGSVSFIGLLTSLPKMVGGMTLSISFLNMLLLFLLITSTLVLLVTFGTMVSCFAKTIKEASSYLGPFTMVFITLAILPGLLGMNNIGYAFVPIINLCVCMSNIVSFGTVAAEFLLLTILTNILFTALIVYITTILFKKERVVIG